MTTQNSQCLVFAVLIKWLDPKCDASLERANKWHKNILLSMKVFLIDYLAK